VILRRHPRPRVLSRYLEGELDPAGRQRLEAHISGCGRCRQQLTSLETMLDALGSLVSPAPAGLADSIIEALRVESPERAAGRPSQASAGSPLLTVISGTGGEPDRDHGLSRWRRGVAAGLRWCLQRRQLRLTVPIAVVAGVVLSLVNMGGMLMHGRIDLGVCLSCAMDFLVPFLALNLALVMLLWVPRHRTPPA
jgi:anti-sigma factor RsiW